MAFFVLSIGGLKMLPDYPQRSTFGARTKYKRSTPPPARSIFQLSDVPRLTTNQCTTSGWHNGWARMAQKREKSMENAQKWPKYHFFNIFLKNKNIYKKTLAGRTATNVFQSPSYSESMSTRTDGPLSEYSGAAFHLNELVFRPVHGVEHPTSLESRFHLFRTAIGVEILPRFVEPLHHELAPLRCANIAICPALKQFELREKIYSKFQELVSQNGRLHKFYAKYTEENWYKHV